MPRGLTQEQVVDRAADLADTDGFETLTLAALAARLGVRTPSLYNHVDGLPDLRRRLALRGSRELAERLRDATLARGRDEGLLALATAHRTFASEHPGLYQALQQAPAAGDDERAAAAAAAASSRCSPCFAATAWRATTRYTRHPRRAQCAARVRRAGAGGGFGIDLDLDESYRRLVATLGAGMRS